MRTRVFFRLIHLLALPSCLPASAADTVRVATYNVENYLLQPTESRPFVKSAEAKAKVRESIRALNPDVLALEEIGGGDALAELRNSLKADGLDFPYWELVAGEDTNIHIAILSKLPIVAPRPHTNEMFLLDGRRFRVSRGFAEVDIRAAPDFTFTLIAAHLKSRRPVPEADEAEERVQEAKILRDIIDHRLSRQPDAPLVVLGDFNDVKDSDAVKEIIGRGRFRLTDTRPAEHNGDHAHAANAFHDPRAVTWTEYYGKEDVYTRMDYILLSPALARAWDRNGTYILTLPDWGLASDHRPIVATFEVRNN
ncbi:MAG TPA: endonuclease/exonuclease/phosphatase family protein [Candidatus Sulfopaludibacter sp.]|nr:endonuclease/exonuclease/phosphatase family protein [Candidatus Sulfopaludibacter sp.]